MSDEKDDFRNRYFKERRLLLGTSVVLLAHQLLPIEIGRSADSIGLHFEFSDPNRLWWGVWLIWTWSLVCSLQLRNVLDLKFPAERMNRSLSWIQRCIVYRKIRRGVKASFRRQVSRRNRIRWSVGEPKLTSADGGAHKHLESDVDLIWRNAPSEPRAVWLADNEAVGDEWWVLKSTGDGIENGDVFHHSGTIALLEPSDWWVNLMARTWAWSTIPHITDYIAPFVIACLPVIVGIAQIIHPAWAPSRPHIEPTRFFDP